MTWKLLPGVRQDSRGRSYQVLVNSFGRQDIVRYEPTGAEQARMIPVIETKKLPRKILTLKGADMTRRRMRVDFRVCGSSEVRTVQDKQEVVQAFVDQHRAYGYLDAEGELARERSEPHQIILAQASGWDYFVQYHVDLKETTNA